MTASEEAPQLRSLEGGAETEPRRVGDYKKLPRETQILPAHRCQREVSDLNIQPADKEEVGVARGRLPHSHWPALSAALRVSRGVGQGPATRLHSGRAPYAEGWFPPPLESSPIKLPFRNFLALRTHLERLLGQVTPPPHRDRLVLVAPPRLGH